MLKKVVSILIIALLIAITSIPAFADVVYNLSCQLDKTTFAFGEEITGIGTLLANSVGDSGQTIAAVIESADGLSRVKAKEFMANADGTFSINMGVKGAIEAGSYVLKVSARNLVVAKPFTVTGNSGSNTGGGPIGGGAPSGGGAPIGGGAPAGGTTGTQSGNSVTVPTPTFDSSKGSASTTLDSNQMSAALNAATGDVKTVVVNIPEVAGAKEYSIGIDPKFLTSSGTSAASQIEIKTSLATLIVPSNMLTSALIGQGKIVSLVIAKADVSGLANDVKAQIGNKPVFEFNVLVDGQKKDWSNPNAPVTVTMAYTPTAEEKANPDNIVIWYIDGQGKVVTISNAKYDAASGKISFSTNHFSMYAVAYINKSLTDIANVKTWAEKEIKAMVAKDIMKEKAASKFEPSTNVTRGEFIYGLVRALGLTASVDGNFKDVAKADYYYNELAIAKKLGIAQGTGDNTYKPTDSITRQDMAALIERSLKAAKKQVKADGNVSQYTDSNKIANYALTSMKAMVAEGILKGDGKNIKPLNNASRAEAAVMLYRIFNK